MIEPLIKRRGGGSGVGDKVGVGDTLGVGLDVGVRVGLGVNVCVAVAVAVAVGVIVGISVAVAVGNGVAAEVIVAVGMRVGVGVGAGALQPLEGATRIARMKNTASKTFGLIFLLLLYVGVFTLVTSTCESVVQLSPDHLQKAQGADTFHNQPGLVSAFFFCSIYLRAHDMPAHR